MQQVMQTLDTIPVSVIIEWTRSCVPAVIAATPGLCYNLQCQNHSAVHATDTETNVTARDHVLSQRQAAYLLVIT